MSSTASANSAREAKNKQIVALRGGAHDAERVSTKAALTFISTGIFCILHIVIRLPWHYTLASILSTCTSIFFLVHVGICVLVGLVWLISWLVSRYKENKADKLQKSMA
jgi:hypothetical protein